MLDGFWEWLQGLEGGAPTVVGTAVGSFLGLVSLLLGALFNAHLNRRRDDRLRNADRRAMAVALISELAGLAQTLGDNAEKLKTTTNDFIVPDLDHSVFVLPKFIDKLGLLDELTVERIIDAYLIIEQYCERLLLMGGRVDEGAEEARRLVHMPQSAALKVATLNEVIVEQIDKARIQLRTYISADGPRYYQLKDGKAEPQT